MSNFNCRDTCLKFEFQKLPDDIWILARKYAWSSFESWQKPIGGNVDISGSKFLNSQYVCTTKDPQNRSLLQRGHQSGYVPDSAYASWTLVTLCMAVQELVLSAKVLLRLRLQSEPVPISSLAQGCNLMLQRNKPECHQQTDGTITQIYGQTHSPVSLKWELAWRTRWTPAAPRKPTV